MIKWPSAQFHKKYAYQSAVSIAFRVSLNENLANMPKAWRITVCSHLSVSNAYICFVCGGNSSLFTVIGIYVMSLIMNESINNLINNSAFQSSS